MSNDDYTPPKVWTWDSESGGKWAGINRPIAGPTHEKTLPVGDKPIQLYSLGTPNGIKITVMLEELLAMGKADAAYDLHTIDIGKGEQFGSGFVELNPNSKIPVILDQSKSPAQSVFESCAILF
ncbi:MAG: glutathione-dependent disulfide-bond oxidoreductase, partial [Gammaproteobacteria bacterium]|nr:glutathione-dependent disulfide-bond oxidoreductase [Gammaproteobacteria bacterium]